MPMLIADSRLKRQAANCSMLAKLAACKNQIEVALGLAL